MTTNEDLKDLFSKAKIYQDEMKALVKNLEANLPGSKKNDWASDKVSDVQKRFDSVQRDMRSLRIAFDNYKIMVDSLENNWNNIY